MDLHHRPAEMTGTISDKEVRALVRAHAETGDVPNDIARLVLAGDEMATMLLSDEADLGYTTPVECVDIWRAGTAKALSALQSGRGGS